MVVPPVAAMAVLWAGAGGVLAGVLADVQGKAAVQGFIHVSITYRSTAWVAEEGEHLLLSGIAIRHCLLLRPPLPSVGWSPKFAGLPVAPNTQASRQAPGCPWGGRENTALQQAVSMLNPKILRLCGSITRAAAQNVKPLPHADSGSSAASARTVSTPSWSAASRRLLAPLR